MRSWMRWSAVLVVIGAMACASKQKVEEKKPGAAAEPGKAAVTPGKVVTNPKEQGFPVVIAKTPVKIDGDLSDWPADLPVGKLTNSDGSRYAMFRVFAVGDRYYASFVVADSTPTVNQETEGGAWNGDTIEFFLGTHDEVHAAWSKGDVQIFVTFNPAAPHVYNNAEMHPMKSTQIVEKQTKEGWLIEMSFTAADAGLAKAAPGAPVWIDVALDNSNGGGRGSQFWWQGDGNSWKKPADWFKTTFVAQQ